MIPRLSNRSARSRAVRGNMGEPRLESLAAEFALLTQRRSRAIHQIEILDLQRTTAAVGFAKLQKRIAWLMQRMDMLTPDLRDPAASGAPSASANPPGHALPAGPTLAGTLSAQAASALAVIGREWAAAQPPHPPPPPHQPTHHDRPIRTRRP